MIDEHPTANLVRMLTDTPQIVRASADDGDGPRILTGRFAVFNEWTEIDSYFEGRFLEQIAPTAFDRAFADYSRVKVLYDHGHDPQLGNKPLGPIRSLKASKQGAEYEVELIDTDYNRGFVIPAAEAGLLGASFRMAVRGEQWIEPARATTRNPERLPERTITDVDLFEFGPVTFPVYASATAGLRSRSDEFLQWVTTDARFLQRFLERTSGAVVGKVLADALDLGHNGADEDPNGAPETLTDDANGTPVSTTRSAQAARMELLRLQGD